MSEADQALLDARDQARAALGEITDPGSIGADFGHEVHEECVVTLFFECRLDGYPGWRWAATVARVDEDSPVNVLEVELLPGAGAVVAPEWVPWSVRLAQYRDAQARQVADEAEALAVEATELDDGDDDDGDELLDSEFADFDGDIDGVDIDELDESKDVDELDESKGADEPDEPRGIAAEED